MKILSIALLGASLLASGAVAAKQPAHLPANANQHYDLYQGLPAGVTLNGYDGYWPGYYAAPRQVVTTAPLITGRSVATGHIGNARRS